MSQQPQEGNDRASNDDSDKDDHARTESLPIDTTQEDVEVMSARLFTLDELPLTKLQNCKRLSVRKNIIHRLSPLPKFLQEQLLEYDLFDNKIKRIDFFVTPNCFAALRKLDLSYNRIKKIEGLQELVTLEELYMCENRISVIEGLDTLVHLKVLELGGNSIREIGSGLLSLISLEELWLGKNKISTLGDAFRGNPKLRRLSVQANRLTELDAVTFASHAAAGDFPSNLKELYISENNLPKLEHLDGCRALEVFDCSMNPISSIENFNVRLFPLLREFWLSDGKIANWSEVDKLREFERTLDTVYLERNPIEEDKRYRAKIYEALPFLVQIDSWPVVNKNNPDLDRQVRK